jgi:hypothetical protein
MAGSCDVRSYRVASTNAFTSSPARKSPSVMNTTKVTPQRTTRSSVPKRRSSSCASLDAVLVTFVHRH